MTDILLDENNDLAFENGDFAVGDSTLQEVAAILQLNQGEMKSSPLTGASLVQLIGSKEKKMLIEKRVRLQMALDGKNYHEIKRYIHLNTK